MITKQAFFELRNIILMMFEADFSSAMQVIKDYKHHKRVNTSTKIRLIDGLHVEIYDNGIIMWYDKKNRSHRGFKNPAVISSTKIKSYYEHGTYIKTD